MWIDESSDPNRFMTVDEHWKYVGTITEDMLDYITLEAESATCVYDAAYDADDLSGLLGNLVKEHKLEEVRDRLKGMLAFVTGENKDELADILVSVQTAMSQFASDVDAIENKLEELKRNLEP